MTFDRSPIRSSVHGNRNLDSEPSLQEAEAVMAEETRDHKPEPETEEAAVITNDELEDLAPSQSDSEAVKGGAGWNRVRNIQ